MADYAAFPVWEQSPPPSGGGQAMLHPEDLAISGRLRARLQEWADAYDAIEFGPNMEVGWRASIPYAEWIAVGRSLAGDLKRELGPDVEILYFDDSTGAEEPV